jgi:hypothetical protein
VAGLAHTTSPVKDAAEHLLMMRELKQRDEGLRSALQGWLIDAEVKMTVTSAMVPLDLNEEQWREMVDELIDVTFGLI